MTWLSAKFENPSELLAAADAAMARIPNERLFVDADLHHRNPQLMPYRPEQGAIDRPSWIEAGVRKKVRKRYSGAKELNILVYVNFSAEGLKYDEVSRRLSQFRGDFASVWVMAHHLVGAVFSTAELGSITG